MAKSGSKPKSEKRRCGLCGKTGKLTKTECCGTWICDDEDEYVAFSYARNSCYRNHRRYTLCGFHHNEQHDGDWKDCEECRSSFETEMYVWYGTNEYNFEKLPNPPEFEPTHCSKCGTVIHLGTDGYTRSGDDYFCETCGAKRLEELFRQTKKSGRRGKPRAGLLSLGMHRSRINDTDQISDDLDVSVQLH